MTRPVPARLLRWRLQCSRRSPGPAAPVATRPRGIPVGPHAEKLRHLDEVRYRHSRDKRAQKPSKPNDCGGSSP